MVRWGSIHREQPDSPLTTHRIQPHHGSGPPQQSRGGRKAAQGPSAKNGADSKTPRHAILIAHKAASAKQEPAYRDMPAPASQEAESLSRFIEAVEVFNKGKA